MAAKRGPKEEAKARAAAEAKILQLLENHARARTTTGYKEIASRVGSMEFNWAMDKTFLGMLDSISAAEDEAGRGMLSALVINKGSGLPGPGFFTLAAARGRDTDDRSSCWQQERDRVWAVWAGA